MEQQLNAPGWPGIAATWTSSAKAGVGCALPGTSRVWFAISHGIVNEIYDRWEEDGGYSPFTLAVEVAALIVAADHADRTGEPAVGKFLRETADDTGSARPLAWAHAEYIKLRRSLNDGQISDRSPQAHERYVAQANQPVRTIWSSSLRCRTLATGLMLRLHTPRPSAVVWSDDGWATTHETRSETRPWASIPPISIRRTCRSGR